MTDITSDCTFTTSVAGDLKCVSIVTPATAATGDTIDLGSDNSDARGTKLGTILNSLAQDDAGADVLSSWVQSTGIITLGTVTTGIHNLLVWGR